MERKREREREEERGRKYCNRKRGVRRRVKGKARMATMRTQQPGVGNANHTHA